MQIVAALFAETLDTEVAEGPSTRLDIGGIRFSQVAPGPFPVTIDPHLFVIVRCAPGDEPDAVLEVRFLRDGEPVARNMQPIMVEPGKFAYRLVRAELEYPGPGTIEAHCALDRGEPVVVPLTLLAP
ncbi:MAG: hypothetical protein H6517_02410 [Microthrixaceae bacterium]|nr:hypothetical protein [Microthrixaceae bacterium]MCB1010958.1 hypothetical protein [Microthrixaceae bacterium]MCB9386662.1 hypothetical protein [Microthrixaceae bacterium]MCO5319967.1 hypothetical protein [Microthrixaceae bacterium]